jgi:hypothetical protein
MRSGGAICCLVLLACGAVPKAPPLLDLQAKIFTPSSGAARIYVYRLVKSWFARYDSRIRIDPEPPGSGLHMGAISKRLYVYADVAAGKHTVTAVTVLYDEGYPKDIASNRLTLDVVAGNIYFVRVELPGTWPVDPPEMRLISTAEGIAAVRDCQLAGR